MYPATCVVKKIELVARWKESKMLRHKQEIAESKKVVKRGALYYIYIADVKNEKCYVIRRREIT